MKPVDQGRGAVWLRRDKNQLGVRWTDATTGGVRRLPRTSLRASSLPTQMSGRGPTGTPILKPFASQTSVHEFSPSAGTQLSHSKIMQLVD